MMDDLHFQIRSLRKLRQSADLVTDVANSVAGDNPVLQPVIEPTLNETQDDLETALQIFMLQNIESIKAELIALCNGNLELLKIICSDVVTGFEQKLVVSLQNQSKTTADILHENHQVLNTAFQEKFDKFLVRGDEKNEALWRRVQSLESTLQGFSEKSTFVEDNMNEINFKVDHMTNAIADLQSKHECVAGLKQASGKSIGLSKLSQPPPMGKSGKSIGLSKPSQPPPVSPSAPGPFVYEFAGPKTSYSHPAFGGGLNGIPGLGSGMSGMPINDSGLFHGNNPPPVSTSSFKSPHPFPGHVFLAGMDPSLINYEFHGQAFKDFLMEMRDLGYLESDVDLLEIFLLLSQNPPTSAQTILLATNDIAKFKRLATLNVSQLPESLGDGCKNTSRMVEEAKNLAKNGFMGISSILSINPLDSVLWLLTTVMCALDDLGPGSQSHTVS